MAEKQKKDRRKAGPEKTQRPDVTIHTADELEELFLASVRAGTFPAKFFPSWAARMQIEVGKVVREGKIQRPPQKVQPSKGVSTKAQSTGAKAETRKSDLPQVHSGLGKFVQVWDASKFPKLDIKKESFIQAHKDGNLPDLVKRAILGAKPADVEPVAYRHAIAEFVKTKLGFKPRMTEKVIGTETIPGKKGKRPIYEIDSEGKPVMVESKFDLIQEQQDGVPKFKGLLHLSEEEFQASQQWLPGVRASLRELSGQKQKRSQPEAESPPASSPRAGGGAAKPNLLAGSGFEWKIKLPSENTDTISVGSPFESEEEDKLEFAEGLRQRLHKEHPSYGFDKIDFDNKDVAEHILLEREERVFSSPQIKRFLELGKRVGAFCCTLYILRSSDLNCRKTAKTQEYLDSGDLERILIDESAKEILDFFKEKAKKAPGSKSPGSKAK